MNVSYYVATARHLTTDAILVYFVRFNSENGDQHLWTESDPKWVFAGTQTAGFIADRCSEGSYRLFSPQELLGGRSGAAAALGSVISEKKSISARLNGARGGRPIDPEKVQDANDCKDSLDSAVKEGKVFIRIRMQLRKVQGIYVDQRGNLDVDYPGCKEFARVRKFSSLLVDTGLPDLVPYDSF